MIEFLILFPLIALPLLYISQKRTLNRVILFTYAAGQVLCAVLLWMGLIEHIAVIPSFVQFFSADGLSRLFFYLLAALFAGVSFSSVSFLSQSKDDRWDTFYTMFIILFAAAMNGVIFSAHLGLLWVFIEATTLTSAVLIYYERSRASLEATWKYIFVCSIGIAFAFVGIIMLTIGAGGKDSLYFTDILANASGFSPFWLKMAFVFLLTGFGTKVGLAPVHAWKPDAYSEAPGPVAALLSGALSNCAFIGIIRVTGIMDAAHEGAYARSLLLVMGILSLIIAAVFMLRVRNYKRMLAYSSIEHMGIVAAGIAIGGPAAFAAMLHITGHSLTKSSLFLSAGSIQKRCGTKEILKIRGLLRADNMTGLLWLAGLLSITAFPPFVTFVSEFMIIQTIFQQHRYVLAVAVLFLLTVILFGMFAPMFHMSFGSPLEKSHEDKKTHIFEYLPQIVFLSAALLLGMYIPAPVAQLLKAAAAVAGM